MSDSIQNDDEDSDASESYTPQPTRTKSGRSVTKPIAYVPVIPEPTPGVKRRKSTKTMLAAKCKTCHRDTDPPQNRIVFCDSCSTAYHQYCHKPPISNEAVTVLDKEWLCGPCARSKASVVQGTENLVAAESLSIDEVRQIKSTQRMPTDAGARNAHTSRLYLNHNSSHSFFTQQYDILNSPYSLQTSLILFPILRLLPPNHSPHPIHPQYNQMPPPPPLSFKHQTHRHPLLRHKSYERWVCALSRV